MMRRFVTLPIGIAVLMTAGMAMAAPSTQAARQYTAVTAYREAAHACERGRSARNELHRLYQAARASGYRGYVPTPSIAEQQCEVEAP
jgi:hypothetical protein